MYAQRLNDAECYCSVLACLQAYASAKESEIRGVCSANYQEFVDSIEEIVRMKADVAKLQRDIDRFQHELASATSGVLAIHDSLDACYRVQRDIDESIEKLQQCQRIVRLRSWRRLSVCASLSLTLERVCE